MEDKLRVAIVYHYFASYRLPILLELMKDKEIEFTFISGKTADTKIKLIDPKLSEVSTIYGGIRWQFVKNSWIWKNKFLWQHGLQRVISKNKFDACIFLGSPYYISTWVSLLTARLRGMKTYLWMHGINHPVRRNSDYFKLVFYRLAGGYFLYGNRAAGFLKQWIKRNDAFHVIYNSLDYEASAAARKGFQISRISDFRKEWFSESNIPTIVFIGRLNKIKRIDLLLKAQSETARQLGKPGFNLIVIGDGEEKKILELISEELSLQPHVQFTGAIYDDAISGKIIQNCDLCVTPGEIGLTAIHALSLGTPVISHDNLSVQMPEVEAIQTGKTGLFFKYDDSKDLTAQISKWLGLFPIKTETLMKDCYEVIDRYYNPAYQAKVFNSVLLNDNK